MTNAISLTLVLDRGYQLSKLFIIIMHHVKIALTGAHKKKVRTEIENVDILLNRSCLKKSGE